MLEKGTNYNVWRLKMKVIFMKKGLWDIVNIETNPTISFTTITKVQIIKL
jgi:hypothetical protein